MSRKISIIGDIDWESFSDFNDELTELESIKKPVDVMLASYGGDVHAALAFVARMRLSPCDVHITVYGYAASAATLILAAGDWRRMTKESWVMVHEDSGRLKGDVSYLKREAAQLGRLEDQWNRLMFEFTGIEESYWEKLNGMTSYLTPRECLDLSLIDEVI